MENLVVTTPFLPTGMNAQFIDTAPAGVAFADATLSGTPGQSFIELLAQQSSLLAPQDGVPVKPVLLQDIGRQEEDTVDSHLDAATLSASVQPTDQAAAAMAVLPVAIAPLQVLMPPAMPGKVDRIQPPVTAVLGPDPDASGGNVLPAVDAKTPDIAASLVDAKVLQSPQPATVGNVRANLSSSQPFGELLAERKVDIPLRQEMPSLQGVPAPLVQPQPMPVANAAPAQQADLVVPQKVGSEAWGAGLGDKVVWVVGNQTRGAEIHLNPPALGPLEVRVNMSDGQANLSFMTQHSAVREAIEIATPRLREMLGDAGITMGSVSVNVGSFAQQQLPSDTSGQGGLGWASSSEAGGIAEVSGNELVSVFSQPLHGRGMVDLFA